LASLQRSGSISRKQISDITGLTPASVTLLCNEMIAEKMLIETGTISMTKGAGRKQVLLELNADYCSILSINIESENTFLVLTDLKSTLLDKRTSRQTVTIPARKVSAE
jgi:transcriptional regulator of PTS gene